LFCSIEGKRSTFLIKGVGNIILEGKSENGWDLQESRKTGKVGEVGNLKQMWKKRKRI